MNEVFSGFWWLNKIRFSTVFWLLRVKIYRRDLELSKIYWRHYKGNIKTFLDIEQNLKLDFSLFSGSLFLIFEFLIVNHKVSPFWHFYILSTYLILRIEMHPNDLLYIFIWIQINTEMLNTEKYLNKIKHKLITVFNKITHILHLMDTKEKCLQCW